MYCTRLVARRGPHYHAPVFWLGWQHCASQSGACAAMRISWGEQGTRGFHAAARLLAAGWVGADIVGVTT